MKKKELITILTQDGFNKSSAGFTLLELIIASFISVVVIGAAGFGLMTMLRGNKTATIEADRRTEINRALEFISDEVRRAQVIDIDPTTAFNNAKNDSGGITYNNFDPEDGEAVVKDNAQPILALRIPGVGIDNNSNGVVERRDIDNNGTIEASENELVPILYYISPPESSAWQGPRVIYRFGPSYNQDGSYSNANDPANWVVEPLVDRIDNDSSGALSASCGSGFTQSIGAEIQGFYGCIENTGKTAQVFAVGQLENGEVYEADTDVYARATAEDLTGANKGQNYGGSPNNNCKRNSTTGGISCPDNVTVKVQVIGSLMGCDPDGAACEMTTEFKVEDSNGSYITKITTDNAGNSTDSNGNSTDSFTLDKDKTLEIVVTPDASKLPSAYGPSAQNNSNPISAISNVSQVIFLRDGDKVPDNLVTWNPDKDKNKAEKDKTFSSLNNLLKEATNSANNKSFIKNGKIDLDPGQYVVAFEVGQTDTSHPGYDLQDHVVLITVKNP